MSLCSRIAASFFPVGAAVQVPLDDFLVNTWDEEDLGHCLVLGSSGVGVGTFLDQLAAHAAGHGGCLYVGRDYRQREAVLCEASRDGGRTYGACVYNPIVDGEPDAIAARIVTALLPAEAADEWGLFAQSHCVVLTQVIEARGAGQAFVAVDGHLEHKHADTIDALACRWAELKRSWVGALVAAPAPTVHMRDVVNGNLSLRASAPDCGFQLANMHAFASMVVGDYRAAVTDLFDSNVRPAGCVTAIFDDAVTTSMHLPMLVRAFEQGRARRQRVVLATRTLESLRRVDPYAAQAVIANTRTKVFFRNLNADTLDAVSTLADGVTREDVQALRVGEAIVATAGRAPIRVALRRTPRQ